MNILIILLIILYGILGGLSTIVLFLGMPAIIIWKIYRRIRYHIAITN